MKFLLILSDITFLILTRLDSIDRLENVLAATNHLKQQLIKNIVLLESAPYNNRILEKLLDKTIQYFFNKDHDPILHRTKYINQMIQVVETPFVAV